MTSDPREQLGRLVRETWVACAEEAGDTKPSHLTGWDDLDEDMREVDMRIGEAVAAAALPDADPEPEDAGRDLRREALAVAYTAGRGAERERIRQLAVKHGATWLAPCRDSEPWHRTHNGHRLPFADLLEGP